ncbi:hypothetical protein D918_07372 [Trichuris suis]|uniref:Uncharacterized protein n=1 Tax=Trichuris suis TaxID=68888 RepID=A0A085LXI3_9BILA|nr:hypothetical protein M513_09511 [Trichuris suis]KHJ42450.1 hypothetical protein D918_07372 [Trichuris suis]
MDYLIQLSQTTDQRSRHPNLASSFEGMQFGMPYHPSSNGQAERMIQTAKNALRHLSTGDLNQRLASFLLSQHTIPCVATGRSPAEPDEPSFGESPRPPSS